jgi:glutathione synthase
VLKPQREGGGGNNLYGDEAASALRRMGPAEKAEYVLMQLVEPPRVRGCLVAKAQRLEGGPCGSGVC